MVTRTDEERVEALKGWWQANGRSVIAALILAIAGVVGYQQWYAYRAKQAEEAASIYSQFNAAADRERAAQAFESLRSEHGSSPYAVLAAMSLARQHADEGALDQAAELLRWAADGADDPALAALARLRLARVLLAREDFQGATAALGEPPEHGYRSGYYELRGDILLAQTQRADAADAYRKALEAAAALGAQRRQLLQMKLDAAGGAAPTS